MAGGDGIISGDVSSTAATDEVPLALALALADPELPQANAWPAMGPTEDEADFVREFYRAFGGHLAISRMPLPLGGPNTGHIAIFVQRTRDDGAADGEEGGDGPPHGDADADNEDDADADADNEDFSFFGAVPASGVAIVCLPETTVGDGEVRGERGECAVCLEEYAAGDAVRTMPCAHGFHERCIFGWLRASRLCPLCRFALPPEEEDDTATDEAEEVGRDVDHQGEDDDDGYDDSRSR